MGSVFGMINIKYPDLFLILTLTVTPLLITCIVWSGWAPRFVAIIRNTLIKHSSSVFIWKTTRSSLRVTLNRHYWKSKWPMLTVYILRAQSNDTRLSNPNPCIKCNWLCSDVSAFKGTRRAQKWSRYRIFAFGWKSFPGTPLTWGTYFAMLQWG